MNIKDLEEIAKKDEINFKRYRDIKYLFNKIKYHMDCFKHTYPAFTKRYIHDEGKQASINAMRQVMKQFGVNPKNLSIPDVNLSIGFRGEINDPIFFNFDSIMIDSNRIIEFTIKFLACCLKINKVKSIENFFKGLMGELENPSNLCEILIKEHKPFSEILIEHWEKWIINLRLYRTNAIHKSIDNHLDGKVKTHSKPGDSIESLEIRSFDITYGDQDITQYLRDLNENLARFNYDVYKYIVDSIYS